MNTKIELPEMKEPMSPEMLAAWLRDECLPEQESQHGCYLKGFHDGEGSKQELVDRLQRENDLLTDQLSELKDFVLRVAESDQLPAHPAFLTKKALVERAAKLFADLT